MDDVPVLGLLNKNKLKSLNFASNLCTIFKSDFDQSSKSAEPSKALKRQRNLLDSDESGDDGDGNRSRGKDGSQQAPKKAREEVAANKENNVTTAAPKKAEIKKYVTESQAVEKQKSSQQGSFGDKISSMNPFGNSKGPFVKKK